jgi:hypothetical protein
MDLIEQHRKTVVLLGEVTHKGITQWATGFLVALGGALHLVTAKHVVRDPESGEWLDEGLSIVYNKKGGGHRERRLDQIKAQRGVHWVFHENEGADVAVLPVPLDPAGDDVLVIHEDMFVGPDRLSQLDDVFFLSFQPGISLSDPLRPVARGGLISLVNEDRTFFIDGFAFPGNSGSPVFMRRAPMRSEEGRVRVHQELTGRPIGIIGSYLPYNDVAVSQQTRRPRVVFEENTGLSHVWSVSFVQEIAQSAGCREQIERLTRGESRSNETSDL